MGKTIEAGLILSELRLRGLADRTLIVVPTGLVGQWQEELERKFGLPSQVATGSPGEVLDRSPIVIASLAMARREPLRQALVARSWDLVILDEAHRVRSPSSASGRLARSLTARHLLLLTATPVENRLDDLHALVSLVRPGLLGAAHEFRARHGSGAGDPRHLEELRARITEVMIRHRRSAVAAMLPSRVAETLRVVPDADEAALYARVSTRVRDQGRAARPERRLALEAVQRMAGSSAAALWPVLNRVGWDDLASEARRVAGGAKVRAAVAVVQKHVARGEKVVVFTAFRELLAQLSSVLRAGSVDAATYHGGLTRHQKEEAVRRFRDECLVLLSTEAAGEGRNLQFCHVMVNFDLPWNPMQIEQRLGRIHRIGQEHEVMLTNLVTRGTIEDRILGVLERKLNLFELVVGELDMILGRVSDEVDLQAAFFDAHLESRDDEELQGRLDALGEALAHARREYLESRRRTDSLVSESAAP